MVSKKNWVLLIKWSVLILAYLYLGYKLWTYPFYSDFVDCFTKTTWQYWLCLAACVGLLPFNFMSESYKWYLLIRPIVKARYGLCCKSVLIGQVGAFPTPNRLGEYPARVMVLPPETRVSSIAMGFVGSIIQTLVIGVCGIGGAILFLRQPDVHIGSLTYYIIIVVAVLILLLLFIVFLPFIGNRLKKLSSIHEWLRRLYDALSRTSFSQFVSVTLVSLLRYLIFCTQLYLMLSFCGVELTAVQAISGISLLYLFVTITPTMGASDLVIRSSYAIYIFSFFSVNIPGIAVASMFLWILNSCVLMLIGSIYWSITSVKI